MTRSHLLTFVFFLLSCTGVIACDRLATSPAVSSAAADTSALYHWTPYASVSAADIAAYGEDRCFAAMPIPDAVFARMQGKSYKENEYVKRSDLRYVRALHYDGHGNVRIGEMVCHKGIAADLVSIFHELYRNKYPIERMVIIDNYDADDEMSMRANNSSCFCYRVVKGSKVLSEHSKGRAVDINTLYNPYVKRKADGTLYVQPATGKPYVDRSAQFPYKITKSDLCYRLFIKHGFIWGGNWKSVKDYQHFEKP